MAPATDSGKAFNVFGLSMVMYTLENTIGVSLIDWFLIGPREPATLVVRLNFCVKELRQIFNFKSKLYGSIGFTIVLEFNC